jgi:glycerol-3-phosphate acyltransferase PlsX
VVCDGFVGNVVLKVAEGLAERLIAVIQSRFQESIGESLRKNELLSVLSAAGASGVASGDASQAGKNPSRAGSSGMEVAASIEGVLTESFARLKQRFDYAEYGGAPLLGVNGVSIIAHGRSDARAIASAVRVAKKMVVAQFNQHITDAIRRSRLTGQEDAAGQGTPESRRENPATSRSE